LTAFDVVELIGALFMLGIVTMWSRVIFGHWWCRYGREAGLAWIVIGANIAVQRLLNQLGIVSGDMRSALNTLVYIVAFCYLIEVTMIHFRWHQVLNRHGRNERKEIAQ